MIADKSDSIDDFLNAVAAKRPTPGGGAVAAVAGALAAAIGEMVFNYSAGKKNLAEFQENIAAATISLQRARQTLLELAVEDQAAFEQLTATRKLPDDSPIKPQQLDDAVAACIAIPQTIAAAASAILEICDREADHVNKFLLSDLAVCAELAMATVRCGVYNVRVNLPDVSDEKKRDEIDRAMKRLSEHSVQTIRSAMKRIWDKA